jgi:hypothetical protein
MVEIVMKTIRKIIIDADFLISINLPFSCPTVQILELQVTNNILFLCRSAIPGHHPVWTTGSCHLAGKKSRLSSFTILPILVKRKNIREGGEVLISKQKTCRIPIAEFGLERPSKQPRSPIHEA